MSNQPKDVTYKKDFNLFRNKVHLVIDQIAAICSEEEFKNIAPTMMNGTSSSNLIQYSQESINQLKVFIDEGFENSKLEEKINKLNELEKNSEIDTAWRPKTGEVDEQPIRAYVLFAYKEKLKSLIMETKMKTDDLSKLIVEKRHLFNQNINNAEKSVGS